MRRGAADIGPTRRALFLPPDRKASTSERHNMSLADAARIRRPYAAKACDLCRKWRVRCLPVDGGCRACQKRGSVCKSG